MNDLDAPTPQAPQPEPTPLPPATTDGATPDLETLIAGVTARLDVLERAFSDRVSNVNVAIGDLRDLIASNGRAVTDTREAVAEIDDTLTTAINDHHAVAARVAALETPHAATRVAIVNDVPATDPAPEPSVPIVAGEPRGQRMKWR